MANLYFGTPPVSFESDDGTWGWPEHEEGESCWCKPRLECVDKNPFDIMIVHRVAAEIKALHMEN